MSRPLALTRFLARTGKPHVLTSLLWATLLAAATDGGTKVHAQVAGTIGVYPSNSTIEIGSTLQCTAYVPISPNTVTWWINNTFGGNSTVGTISSTGFYTAPAVAPANNVVTISVKSTAYPSSIGTTSLTITRHYPWLWSVSPSKLTVGNYSVSFNGANFAPDSQASANGVPIATTYYSPTKVVVTGAAAQVGTIQFAVSQPGNGAVTGNSVAVQVAAVPITVTVAPKSATVVLGNSQTFAATVTGSTVTSVSWSVNGTTGGSSATGTISATGVYTAPSVLPASATVTIRATSTASPTSYGQSTVTLTAPPPPVTVAVAPAAATVTLSTSQSFSATVTGSSNQSVTWSVNGVAGGSATLGTISSSGVYTAPAAMPVSPTVTITATAVVNPADSALSTVTLVPPPPPVTVAVAPSSGTVQAGNSQTFVATLTGTANAAVTWSVNGTVGGSSTYGTISATGVYSAPTVTPASPVVTILATSVANPSASGQATLTVTSPPPPVVSLSNARFLEQSSFGPSPASLARLQQIGMAAYLDEQFAMPETVIPMPPDNSMGALEQWVLYNYTSAPDQLRQRVAYALSQIVVTSAAKLINADEIIPWLQILSKYAFGNYRDLLHDVSMCPSMGKYLDLANSMAPGLAGGANENYARESMQLFTIGVSQLNPDGSLVTDASGNPVPTYDQATVRQVALVLTGWTYATAPGATPQPANWEYFGAPMETRPLNHDTTAKTYLGCSVPAGQTVEQDLNSYLDCLMNHPNIGPFIATRLIRALVTSNPSPGYIQRVGGVFVDNGAGVRGDLSAVIRAILTDAEARQDTPTVNQGRLKEPIVQIAGFLRALNGQFTPGQGLTYLFDYMAQPILTPPSVFSWFSPLYHIPKSPLFGPEFQVYTPTEATLAGNFIYEILHDPGTDMIVDLSPFQPYGNDMPTLVEAANQALLYGQMPAAMKQALINAATPGYDAPTRIETVLYLTGLSGLFAVQQ